MSRNLTYILAMGLVSTVIMALIVIGTLTAFNTMLIGGMVDVIKDYQLGIWDVSATKGIVKIICSGPVALFYIWLIQKNLAAIDWLGKWKAGRV